MSIIKVVEKFRQSQFEEGVAGDTFVQRLQDNISQIKNELEEDNLQAYKQSSDEQDKLVQGIKAEKKKEQKRILNKNS